MLTALRQIFANLGQVLRIFLLPCLIATAIIFGGIWIIYEHRNMFPGQAAFTLMLTALICGLWSAVNFHRHILLGERFGWLPRLHIRENHGLWHHADSDGACALSAALGHHSCCNRVDLRAEPEPARPDARHPARGAFYAGEHRPDRGAWPAIAQPAARPCHWRGAARLYPPRGSIATVLLIALILSGLRIGYSILLWAMMMTPIDPPTIIFVLQSTWSRQRDHRHLCPDLFHQLLTALYAQYVGKAGSLMSPPGHRHRKSEPVPLYANSKTVTAAKSDLIAKALARSCKTAAEFCRSWG